MKNRILNTEVVVHGKKFVAELTDGLHFECPECNTELGTSDVVMVEPNTRHSYDVTHRSKIIMLKCHTCSCAFKLTVK